MPRSTEAPGTCISAEHQRRSRRTSAEMTRCSIDGASIDRSEAATVTSHRPLPEEENKETGGGGLGSSRGGCWCTCFPRLARAAIGKRPAAKKQPRTTADILTSSGPSLDSSDHIDDAFFLGVFASSEHLDPAPAGPSASEHAQAFQPSLSGDDADHASP